MKPASSRQPMEIPPDLSLQGFLVGTSGYYYDDWVGIFNPPRIRARYNAPRQSENVSSQTDLLPLPDEERAARTAWCFTRNISRSSRSTIRFIANPPSNIFWTLSGAASRRCTIASKRIKTCRTIPPATWNSVANSCASMFTR